MGSVGHVLECLWRHDVPGGDGICIHMHTPPFTIALASPAFERMVGERGILVKGSIVTFADLMANEPLESPAQVYSTFIRRVESTRPRPVPPRMNWRPKSAEDRVLETQMHALDGRRLLVSVTRDVTTTVHRARRMMYETSTAIHRSLVHALNDQHKNSVLRALTAIDSANAQLQASNGTASLAPVQLSTMLSDVSLELQASLGRFSLECARHEISAGAYVCQPARERVDRLFAGAHALQGTATEVCLGAHTAAPGNGEAACVYIDVTPLRLAVSDAVKSALAYGTGEVRVCVSLSPSTDELQVVVSHRLREEHERAFAILTPDAIDELFDQDTDILNLTARRSLTHRWDSHDDVEAVAADAVELRIKEQDPGVRLSFVRCAARKLGGDATLAVEQGRMSLSIRVPVKTLFPPSTLDLISRYRVPADTTVVIVDDSRVVRATMLARAIKLLKGDGIDFVTLPNPKVADDSPKAREVLTGYEKELTGLVETGRVLLLTDQNLGLGIPTGSEIIQSVRKCIPQAQYNLVAFIVSANTEASDREHYLIAGADGVIGKAKSDLADAFPGILAACTMRYGEANCLIEPHPPPSRLLQGTGCLTGARMWRQPSFKESVTIANTSTPPEEAQRAVPPATGADDAVSGCQSDGESLWSSSDDSDASFDFEGINMSDDLLSVLGMPIPARREPARWLPPEVAGLDNSRKVTLPPRRSRVSSMSSATSTVEGQGESSFASLAAGSCAHGRPPALAS